MGGLRSGGFEPVLVDFDVHGVGVAAGVVGPDLALEEADAVQRLGRLAAAAVGQLFGVAERAQQALDDADLAADVERRPDVAGRMGRPHAHPVADAEAGVHGVWASRASTSA